MAVGAVRQAGPSVAAVALAALCIVALHEGRLGLVGVAVLGPPVLLALAARPELGLAALLAATPLMGVALPVADSSVPVLRVALPLLALWVLLHAVVLAQHGSRPPAPARTLVFAVVFVLAVMVASAIGAVEPLGTLRFLTEFATAVLAFFAALQIAERRNAIEVVLAGALSGLALAAGYGLLQALTGTADGGGIYVGAEAVERLRSFFPHPNFYAAYLMVLLPVAVAVLVSRAFTPLLRALALLAAGLAVPALMLTYSRASIVGLAVGAFVWLVLLWPKKTIAAATAIALLALIVAPGTVAGRFNADTGSADLALRTGIWRGALDVATQHPLLGAGISNFPFAYARTPAVEAPAANRPSIPEVGGDELPPTAHNIYLNVLAEQGMIGLLAFCVLAGTIVWTLRDGRHARDPRTRVLCAGVGVAVVTWAVAGILDTIPFSQAAIALFALIGLAAAASWRDAPAGPAETTG